MIRPEFSFGDSIEFKENWVEPEGKYQPWQEEIIFKYSLLFDTSHLNHCFFFVRKAVQWSGGRASLLCVVAGKTTDSRSTSSLFKENYFFPDWVSTWTERLSGFPMSEHQFLFENEIKFQDLQLKAHIFTRIQNKINKVIY